LAFCEVSTIISCRFETNSLAFSMAFPKPNHLIHRPSEARQEVLPAASPLIIQPVHLFDSNIKVIYEKMPPNRSPAFSLSLARSGTVVADRVPPPPPLTVALSAPCVQALPLVLLAPLAGPLVAAPLPPSD
jgi:hypothetical protein